MKYELEYAEKRLEHYRKTVKEGKLKEYLRTGRPKKEDWFRVEEGSALEDYLKSTDGKTNNEYQRDKNRLKEFPYIWKLFSEETNVKCPECGKLQPWCYDTGCSNAKLLIIFAMLALFFGSFFLWPSIVESLSPSADRMIILGIFVLPILVGILLFKMIRKITVSRYAKMPWNADDLPVYDAEYISEFRRLNWPEPGEKSGK
ncbi:MAG: hypothetical protein K6D94_11570 [Clostridiales bacterium]|nr:hypothetical protein [Clostridiales bacterium]